jgi:hypothetical protein
MKQPRDYALMLLRKAANDLIAAEEVYGFTVRQLGLGYEQPEDWYIN